MEEEILSLSSLQPVAQLSVVDLAVVPRIDRQRLGGDTNLVGRESGGGEPGGDVRFKGGTGFDDDHQSLTQRRVRQAHGGEAADSGVISLRRLLHKLRMDEDASSANRRVDPAGEPETAFKIERAGVAHAMHDGAGGVHDLVLPPGPGVAEVVAADVIAGDDQLADLARGQLPV